MEDIYDNLDNYNEEATIQELQNENKELRFQLEELNSKLETLQKDFDKLCSEHKKLESNYSSLLKTAKAEVERKTQAISLLNAEKDKLVLQTLQNRNHRPYSKYSAPAGKKKKDDKRSNNNNETDKQSIETGRNDTRISPKDDRIKSVTDYSTKENISQKRLNNDDKPRSLSIKNRRKSMPAFDINPKFSSEEEDITNVGEYVNPREYPDRYYDRYCRFTNRTSEFPGQEERNTYNYELTKDPKNRPHRNVENEKPRNYERSEFSQRQKRDSPGRSRRRNRDAYEDKRSDYDRYRRLESPPNDKYRRLESPPNDKYSNYSLRQHPNYEKLRYQDSDRYSSRSHDRHATKHKAPEYDEPKSKKMKPNTYQRQYGDEKWNHEKHQIADEYDKQFTSCQSPDINFMEYNPNHQITEIKLSATTKLDDPRKSSDRYVKDTKGKDTLIAVRGMNVDIPRLPLENTSYEIEYVKMPEALKERPTYDDLLNQIYNDVDNPVLNVSIESGEIPFDPQHKVLLEPHLPNDEKGKYNKNSAKTSVLANNPKQNIDTYKIPKIKSCTASTQSNNNKDVNEDLSVKHKNGKSSDNTKEDKSNNSKRASDHTKEVRNNNSKIKRKTALNKDLKKDINTDLKETSLVVDKSPQLPTLNADMETKNKHEKKNKFQKIVEDDLELSDETCDYTETHKTKYTVSKVIDNKTVSVCETSSPNLVQSLVVSLQVDTETHKDNVSKVTDKTVSVGEASTNLVQSSEVSCEVDTETHKTKDTESKVTDNKTVSVGETSPPNFVQSSEVPREVDTCKDKSPGPDTKIKSKKRQSKHKKTQDKTIPANQIEKPAKKVKEKHVVKSKEKHEVKSKEKDEVKCKEKDEVKSKEKHEVKSKEIIQHKFSELFGDSNSLILPEDLGLSSVPAHLIQPADLPIFEDAQDAIDLNVNKELPKFNEIETNKLPIEKDNNAKAPKVNNKTEILNKDIRTHAGEIPMQSIYQNLEVCDKPKEDAMKTVIISTGVQPSVPINNNKPLEEHSIPININLKALATSTPHKLPSEIPDINTKVTQTNGHADHSKEVNAMDSSLSSFVDKSNDTDVPDVRIVVKRRRKVMKKP